MTIGLNGLALAAVAYVAGLFAVAWAAERRAAAGGGAWLRSPVVYALSLSIYCTGWTFYGAVGYAARTGLEFLTIYLGPSLVMIGWWGLVRRLVRVGRAQRATSIADLVSSRYGKSAPIAALVTLIAVAGITPYIALQLQSIALSVAAFAGDGAADLDLVALWTALGLAAFTILFGTRNLDAGERHPGIVTAIALEAVVKLGALLAVGAFVVWGLAGGVGPVLDRIDAAPVPMWGGAGGRWVGLTLLSAAAFLTLPRMFHVLVVEATDERHLALAGWAFPLYLLLMSLVVVPVAVVGLERMPAGSNPDLFVLTLPLAERQGGLALLAFLGGLSSASSMVIVAAIALSTMISNHVVAPLLLRGRAEGAPGGDLRGTILAVRRVSIAGLLALGLVYFRATGPGSALSAIGLIAFAGVAQILPALLGGLLWRGATGRGAAAGLVLGAATWAWTLLLPALGGGLLSPATLAEGPWGIGWLRPEALFGIEGIDPLLHAAMWSLLLNAAAFVGVSLLTFPSPLERLQGEAIVHVFERDGAAPLLARAEAEPERLLEVAGRILGPEPALDLFRAEAAAQGVGDGLPDPTPGFLDRLERELAGSVGAAAAHAVLGRLARGAGVSVEALMAVADEAQAIKERSARLEAAAQEQERTGRALREANERLTRLAAETDGFLSRVSHELRTPMTAIRAFSSLLAEEGLEATDARRFARTVEAEAQRLTRLLDELLDLSVLRGGRAAVAPREVTLADLLDRAVAAAGILPGGPLRVLREPAREAVTLVTDPDRLVQVFVNLAANARKYARAAEPELRIAVGRRRGRLTVDFVDNGPGIARADREAAFDPFVRLADGAGGAGGAGLGLAICREIMGRLGGTVAYLPGQGGGAFRVTLPLAGAPVPEPSPAPAFTPR